MPLDDSASLAGSLRTLPTFPDGTLARVDIARMNLLCAEGLPGVKDMDVEKCLVALDAMAARVRTETDRHFYRFQKNPAEFESSEGFFRMVIMGVVLAEDFHVKYAAAKAGTAAEARTGDGFFADPDDVFLSGLLGSKRQGTCSSLPVLYVAIGRKLDYPLKLVTTKGHLFVRWEDAKERFNIEVTGRGVNTFPDDYYRHWPMKVSDEEIEAESTAVPQLTEFSVDWSRDLLFCPLNGQKHSTLRIHYYNSDEAELAVHLDLHYSCKCCSLDRSRTEIRFTFDPSDGVSVPKVRGDNAE